MNNLLSMRDLFNRQGIEREVISLRNSLSNHVGGLQMGLREAHLRFRKPADGNGAAVGCRSSETVKFVFGVDSPITGGFGKIEKSFGEVIPAWMPVSRDETRTVEGILLRSHITSTDFPPRPWHTYYDWNFHVLVDRQYTYLMSEGNIEDKNHYIEDKPSFECEWDTAFLPNWAWPQEKSRIWMVGRWIYDCGHPFITDPSLFSKLTQRTKVLHRTELHPVKAVASFRSEAIQLPGNNGPTRVNQAVLFIGRFGGYWDQSIIDQDYAFDLYLPPKPYAEAEPRIAVQPMTGNLPVEPIITPFPATQPRALRVLIPLKGVQPEPNEYGAIISGGWSDPRGTESSQIIRVRITIEKILMHADLDPRLGEEDDWFPYIGINGRWKTWQNLSGNSATLNFSVVLDLHPEDTIRISAKGFEGDSINKIIGRETGLSWQEIVDHQDDNHIAGKIKDAFLSIGIDELAWYRGDIENDPLHRIWRVHHASEQELFKEFKEPSPEEIIIISTKGIPIKLKVRQYSLVYRIERL